MKKLDHWDRRFLALADFIAEWSKDPSTKVGAVITHTKSRRIVSTGFNGFPAGVEDAPERLFDRATKYEMIVHAEQNALMFAGQHAEGCTLYVTPLPPCARCAALIIQAGIARQNEALRADYQRLVAIRKNHPALRRGTPRSASRRTPRALRQAHARWLRV